MHKTIILTGIPRSGSTLSCAILNNFQNTVALMEPMNVMSIDTEKGSIEACREVLDFSFECRKSIIYTSKVITKQKDGLLPTNPLSKIKNATTKLRDAIVSKEEIKITNVTADFTLVIKHNAFFTAILKDLKNFFPVYGIIRNPLSVLLSWQTVNLPINSGHIPAGERFDKILYNKLTNEENTISRQLIILDWFFENFSQNLNPKNIIKYEDIIEDSTAIFSPLSYNQIELENYQKLQSNNTSNLYQDLDITMLYEKLIASNGAYWHYYSKDKVTQIYNTFL